MPLGIAGQIGAAAASQVISEGLGLAFGKSHDKRQIEQQKKLTDVQTNANKQMADYGQKLALDMWDKTNYSAQKAQLEKAGLNPALMYGMKGGGGVTTSGGQASGVSGGQASGAAATQGANQQYALMNAQMGLIQAQTEKTKAEAANIGGEIKTGLQIDNQLKGIQATVNEATTKQQIEKIQMEVNKLYGEVESAQAKGAVDAQTIEEQVAIIKQTAINTFLDGELKRAGIEVTNTQVEKLKADIAQGWAELDIKTIEAKIKATYPGMWNVIGRSMEDFFDGIGNIFNEKRQLRAIK